MATIIEIQESKFEHLSDCAEQIVKHGKNHVEMHICKEFGIDPYSEKAAYLSGQLAKKLFKAQLRNWTR